MKKCLLLITVFFSVFQLTAQDVPGKTETDSTVRNAVDSAELYGYIPERPVKVGGGPAEQRAYLGSLRDAQGNRVTFNRLGSCCHYKTTSPLAMFGSGLLDIYVIHYRDEKNKKQKTKVYITFYDYEEPKAIKGFTKD